MARWTVYVGGVTGEVWEHYPRPDPDTVVPAEGIVRLSFDEVTGALTREDTTAGDLRSPQYLELHPHLPVLYAAEFARPSRLVTFAVAPDGTLARQAAVDSRGTMAAAVAVHPRGGITYVGHLGDGTLAAVDAGGVRTVPPRPGSALHHVRVTPSGSALLATDFGRDELAVHALDEDGGVLPEPRTIAFPAGSRPRHLELDPSGEAVYVVGEGDARLYVLAARDHVPSAIGAVLPLGAAAECSPSELHLHPRGGLLYVGVRTADLVAVVEVDGTGGARVRSYAPSCGRSPRTLAVHPGGRHLLVGNWHSNELVVFGIDDEGDLHPLGEPVALPSPSSIVVAPAR